MISLTDVFCCDCNHLQKPLSYIVRTRVNCGNGIGNRKLTCDIPSHDYPLEIHNRCTSVYRGLYLYEWLCLWSVVKIFGHSSTPRLIVGIRSRVRMVVGFTTTCAISAKHH
jgi:hypothetical protein